MKKKWIVLAMFLALALVLTGCACKHEWVEATCLTPKTCSKCEEVEGEALGHTWVEATCETPKTCSVCAATEGEALGHTWVEATCEAPKTCSVCAATEGEALGHTWVEATCEAPKTCSACAATEGEALGHTFAEADCVTPKTCTVCAATEGEALGHTFADADCVTPKTCTVCAATEGEALGHAFVDADCVTPKTCSACGATEGEALGHTFVDGSCSRCGEAQPFAAYKVNGCMVVNLPAEWNVNDEPKESKTSNYISLIRADKEDKSVSIELVVYDFNVKSFDYVYSTIEGSDAYKDLRQYENAKGVKFALFSTDDDDFACVSFVDPNGKMYMALIDDETSISNDMLDDVVMMLVDNCWFE